MRIGRTTLLLGTMLAGSLSPLACGDDKKEPSTFTTGVDTTKPLGMLTPDEATAVCKSTQGFANRTIAEARQKELSCRLTAIGLAAVGSLAPGTTAPESGTPSDAELQMSCQSAFDQCMARATTPAGQEAACQMFPPSCMATVGEYETCLNDLPPFLDQSVSTVPSCNTLTRVSLITSFATWTALINAAPPSCKTFQMKCGVGIPGATGPGGGGVTPPAP